MDQSPRQTDLVRARRIDECCNRFEEQWRSGRRPRMEDVVSSTPEVQRAELLRALLSVELELLAREGKRPAENEYHSRFPSDTEVIRAVFAESVNRRAGNGPRDVATLDTSAPRSSVRDPGKQGSPSTGPYSASRKATDSSTVPTRIGRFEILDVLGEGAFGKVYRARDPKLDREVALKVPLPGVLETDRDVERFLREAKSAAVVQHPNICPVHEVGQDGDTHYIVMAYVPGQSLAAMLKARKSPMPQRQVALVVRKLALALEAAHAKGIVHRDLKPGNILYDRDRKDMVITDFGLARRIRKDEAQLTQSGVIMGTPTYMSPEQARGDVREVGPRSDVYSMGVILYEMLCGVRPFAGSIVEVIGQVLYMEPEPPSKHLPGLDAAMEAICLKAMAKDANRRYGSMKELADALNDYLKRTASAEASVKSDAGTNTRAVAELVKELANEHKAETAAAVEDAVKRARVPFWAWLAGTGFMGVMILLGILFFVRGGPATIIIQVPLPEGISLKDTTLSFFLDGKAIPAEELEKPIELKLGDHELLIKRGEQTIQRMVFTVGMKGKEVSVEVKELTEPQKKPPDKTPPKDQPDKTPPVNFKEYRRLEGEHTNAVNAVAFSPDGRFAVSGDQSGWIVHWDLTKHKEILGVRATPGSHITSLAVTPNGKSLLIGGRDAPVLWDLVGNKEIRTLQGHAEGTSNVALSADGSRAATASDDRTARVWDATTGKSLQSFEGHTHKVYSAALSPDGRYLLSGSFDQTIRLWDAKSGKEIREMSADGKGARNAIFLKDSRHALTAGWHTGEMRLWDVETGKAVRRFKGHETEIFGLALSKDESRVLTTSTDGTIRLWDTASGRELHRIEGKDLTDDVRCIALSPDGRYALSGHRDWSVRLWRLPEPK